MSNCPACNGNLANGLRTWHRICATCGYEGSMLNAHILDQAPGGDLDEVAREDALESLRRSNFRRLGKMIDRLTSCLPSHPGRPRLLDVGCAHGWFIEQTRDRYDTIGIEPDHAVALATAARGLPVREGFFPAAVQPHERFDVIVFNDVLEHIPDIHATLEACRQHLVPGGLLVVNAPNRGGVLYGISRRLLRIGRPGAFDRLWQVGFPSPHVHYLDSQSMRKIAGRHGFSMTETQRLPSISISGLYSRIRYSKEVSPLKAALMAFVVACAVPVLAVLPPDIEAWFLRNSQGA